MTRLHDFIKHHTTPAHLTPWEGIRYWQERILLILLVFGVGLGLLAWIPSIFLSIRESLWAVAVMDTLVLGFTFVLFFNRRLSYAFRAVSFCLLSYFLGLVLIFTIGPFGAGPVWLFFFPVLTGLLLKPRHSVWALVLNAVTIVFVGYLINTHQSGILAGFQLKTWHVAQENPGIKWGVICSNFMLLNILTTVCISTIVNGLHGSLTKLATSEKKYRQIYENIIDVYFEISSEGIILETSPSVTPVLSYSQEELRGASVECIYFTQTDRAIFLDKLFEEGQVNGYELELKDKNGERRISSVNARLIRDDQGEPRRVVGIFRDISEEKAAAVREKKLQEKLNQSQKMELLGTLAGGVAHDLNNVLSGIVTYPELLLIDQPEGSPMARKLEIIQKSGQRAMEIVQDLLTLSRRGVVTRQVVDLHIIIREFLITPEYRKILSFHPHVRMETRFDAACSRLKGSAVHLQKTVMNLVSNAAEAQPKGGVIKIATETRHLETPVKGYDRVRAGEYLLLSVQDHGQGIDPGDLQRIFEPFFTKKVMGRSGTGLGMTVVQGTVQDHDGYIEVTSPPGKGTRFDLYFPVTDAPLGTGKTHTKISSLAGNGERILVVDDTDDQRKIAGDTFRRLGYQVRTVESGEAAVAYLKKQDVDLVLLDMMMPPGIDGLETLRRIQAFKPEQKVVIASGFAREHQVRSALDLGALQYVKKPYSIEKIGLAARNALKKGHPGPKERRGR